MKMIFSLDCQLVGGKFFSAAVLHSTNMERNKGMIANLSQKQSSCHTYVVAPESTLPGKEVKNQEEKN